MSRFLGSDHDEYEAMRARRRAVAGKGPREAVGTMARRAEDLPPEVLRDIQSVQARARMAGPRDWSPLDPDLFNRR